MSEPFPAIAEASATGTTADLFADIRTTVGVRVVNLVWRHLATVDEALPWAWAAVKPLYVEGYVDEAARRFRETMVLPRLAFLTGDEPASVDAVLASYDHSNTINLLALGALVAWLRDDKAVGAMPQPGSRLVAPDLSLPELASEPDVSPAIWARVVRLNRLGDRPQPLILASMYRHLAHAPRFLERLEDALVPVQTEGSLDRAIATNRVEAWQRSRVLACAISAPPAPGAPQIEASVSSFVKHAIGKMVTIGRAIRVARKSV